MHAHKAVPACVRMTQADGCLQGRGRGRWRRMTRRGGGSGRAGAGSVQSREGRPPSRCTPTPTLCAACPSVHVCTYLYLNVHGKSCPSLKPRYVHVVAIAGPITDWTRIRQLTLSPRWGSTQSIHTSTHICVLAPLFPGLSCACAPHPPTRDTLSPPSLSLTPELLHIAATHRAGGGDTGQRRVWGGDEERGEECGGAGFGHHPALHAPAAGHSAPPGHQPGRGLRVPDLLRGPGGCVGGGWGPVFMAIGRQYGCCGVWRLG